MSYLLTAVKRTAKGEKTREEGKLPAVAYGAGNETMSLDLDYSQFTKMFKQAGESSLIDLEVDGKNIGKVLVQEVQYNAVKGTPIHIDLRRIDMNKAMQAPVSLKFMGEAPAVKEMGGTLVRNIEEVTVECLPKDLVSIIEVVLTTLKTFDDAIKVRDLVLPAGMTVVAPHGDALVAKAVPALTEDQLKALEEAGKSADISKIEVAGQKEKEEAAAAAAATEEKK